MIDGCIPPKSGAAKSGLLLGVTGDVVTSLSRGGGGGIEYPLLKLIGLYLGGALGFNASDKLIGGGGIAVSGGAKVFVWGICAGKVGIGCGSGTVCGGNCLFASFAFFYCICIS